jgi:hypothetical protein
MPPTHQQLYRAASTYVEAGLSLVPAGTNEPFTKQPHYAALKATGHSIRDEEGAGSGRAGPRCASGPPPTMNSGPGF